MPDCGAALQTPKCKKSLLAVLFGLWTLPWPSVFCAHESVFVVTLATVVAEGV